MPAPIALFVYKRLSHAQRTVQALLGNDLAATSDLHVFSDGAKDSASEPAVSAVRRYVRTIGGFASVTVVERPENAGLARSIIDGVTTICENRGRVIVVEDDLLTSRWFLTYMNDALDLYADDEEVASIHGYWGPVQERLPETFFLRGADCWGWGTWSRAWRGFEPDGRKLLRALTEENLLAAFDLDGAYPFSAMLRDQIAGRNDSWAVRWHASCFLKSRLTLYPCRNLVRNIGNDGTGTHTKESGAFDSGVSATPIAVRRIELQQSEPGRAAFARFLRGTRKGPIARVLQRLRTLTGSARGTRSY